MYWAFLRSNEIYSKKSNDRNYFKDAFSSDPKKDEDKDNNNIDHIGIDKDRYVLFRVKNNMINIHYLHGAIHVFDISSQTFKIRKKTKKSDIYLRLDDVIKKFYKKIKINKLDELRTTVVLEGASEFKEQYIASSAYLGDMYSRFDELEGNLVIYGCKLTDDGVKFIDDHIWRRVFKKEKIKKFRKIYIGIHEYIDEPNFESRKKEILGCIRKCRHPEGIDNIIFFSTRNEPTIWSKISV